jgi:hypothetical protein
VSRGDLPHSWTTTPQTHHHTTARLQMRMAKHALMVFTAPSAINASAADVVCRLGAAHAPTLMQAPQGSASGTCGGRLHRQRLGCDADAELLPDSAETRLFTGANLTRLQAPTSVHTRGALLAALSPTACTAVGAWEKTSSNRNPQAMTHQHAGRLIRRPMAPFPHPHTGQLLHLQAYKHSANTAMPSQHKSCSGRHRPPGTQLHQAPSMPRQAVTKQVTTQQHSPQPNTPAGRTQRRDA